MRAHSASSTKLDSYDAGFEVGRELAELAPELVVVFASIHYDFVDFHEGLVDGLGREDVEVFGGTGDGFFETRAAADIGVAALGIASAGALGVHVHVEPELGADSRAAARRAAEAIARSAGEAPVRLAMVLYDGLECGDNRVVEGINEVLDCPVFGGITSDDRKMERSLVIHRDQAHANAIGLLGLTGELAFALGVENGASAVGASGVVEATTGNTLERIEGLPAIEFTAKRLSKDASTFTNQDIGVLNFECASSADMADPQYRSVSNWQRGDGALETFGPVEVGQHVRVALVTSDELLAGARTVLDALDRERLDFEPVAGLAISCAGRKWFLGQRYGEEAEVIRDNQPGLPFIGFPSLGEIAPRRRADGSYSTNLFHNVSLVVALLGRPRTPDRAP